MAPPNGISINKTRPAPLGVAGNFFDALKKNALYKNYNNMTGQVDGIFDEGDPNYDNPNLQEQDAGRIPVRTDNSSLVQPLIQPIGTNSVPAPAYLPQLQNPSLYAGLQEQNPMQGGQFNTRSINPLEGLKDQLTNTAVQGSPARYNPLQDLAILGNKQKELAANAPTPYDLQIIKNHAANIQNQALLQYQQNNAAPQIHQPDFQPLPQRQNIPIPVRGDATNERSFNVAAGLSSLLGGGNTDLSSLQGLTEHGRAVDQRDYTDAQRLYGQKQNQADQGYNDAVASRDAYKNYLDQQSKTNFANDTSKFEQGGTVAKLQGDVNAGQDQSQGLDAIKSKYTEAAQTKAEIDNQLEQITAKSNISDNDVKDYNTGVQTLEKVQGLISQGKADEAAQVLAQYKQKLLETQTNNEQQLAPYKLAQARLGLQGQVLDLQGQQLKNQYTKAQTDKLTKNDPLDQETQRLQNETLRQNLIINKAKSNLAIIDASKVEVPEVLTADARAKSNEYQTAFKVYNTAKTRIDAQLLKEAKNVHTVQEGGFLGIGAHNKLDANGKPITQFSDAYNAKKAEADAELAPLKADLDTALEAVKASTDRAVNYIHDVQHTQNAITQHYSTSTQQSTGTSEKVKLGKVQKQPNASPRPTAVTGQLPPGVQVVP